MRQIAKNSLVRELQRISRTNEVKNTCEEHSNCSKKCPDRKVGWIRIGEWEAHLNGWSDKVQDIKEFFSDFGEFPMLARRIARTGKKLIKISMEGGTNENTNALLEEFKKIAHNEGFDIKTFKIIPRTSSTDGYAGGSYGPAFELIIGWS